MHSTILYGFSYESDIISSSAPSMEKRAFIGAIGSQIAQNVLVKGLMKSKSINKELANQVARGLKGQKEGLLKRFSSGIRSGMIAPEITSLSREALRSGENIRLALAKKGVTKLSTGDIAIIRRLLKGDYNKAVKSKKFLNELSKSSNVKNILKTKHFPGSDQLLEVVNLMKTKANKSEVARKLQSIGSVLSDVKKSPTTALGFPFLRKSIRNVRELKTVPQSRLSRAAGSISESAGTLTGAGMVAPIDPITAGLNVGKASYYAPSVRRVVQKVKPLGRVQRWLDRKILKNPIKKSFKMGREGAIPTRAQRIGNVASEYLINPVPVQMARTARHLGQASRARNITNIRPASRIVRRQIRNNMYAQKPA